MSALLFAALKSNLQVLIEFLVCAGCGVYYGQLDFNPQEKSENITTETKLLQYPCLLEALILFVDTFFFTTNKTFKGKTIKFHWGVIYMELLLWSKTKKHKMLQILSQKIRRKFTKNNSRKKREKPQRNEKSRQNSNIFSFEEQPSFRVTP